MNDEWNESFSFVEDCVSARQITNEMWDDKKKWIMWEKEEENHNNCKSPNSVYKCSILKKYVKNYRNTS